ncbi:hypothetical protein C1H46_032595 [Malus baccata]|uniref:PDZ domain-containing protein n=1 Tax=Malus baccata TaxID=106549 RepID=A0A540L6G1_MALBA|nr:hypothetical protein C1H46_032595 [Malus baccata]
MSQAVLAAASSSSSSCSAPFKRHHSTRTPQFTTPKQLAPIQCQKTSFQGLSLGEAKRGVFDSLLVAAENNRSGLGNNNVGKGRGLRVTARTAGASKSVEAVNKPLGLTLGQKPGGPVTITAVDGGGNAAKAGLEAGDQVLYTGSFFACPQCLAPKKRFARYDINTGKAIGGSLPPIGVIIGLVAGLAGVGALLVYGLQ